MSLWSEMFWSEQTSRNGEHEGNDAGEAEGKQYQNKKVCNDQQWFDEYCVG